jgi:hypothetical protein
VLRRLDAPESTARRSTVAGYAGLALQLAALSDDGQRAVLATKERIAVVDADSGREAASATLDQLGGDARSSLLYSRWSFVGDTVVGFLPPGSAGLPLVVSSFDFRTGRVTPGPRVEGFDWVRQVRDGRALVMQRNALAIVDGVEVHVLVPGTLPQPSVDAATFLDGGGAAALLANRLIVWNREGQRTLDAPRPAGAFFISGEPRSGWLAVATSLYKTQETMFVDLVTGTVVREEKGLMPAGGWNDDQTLPPGSPGARLFIGTRGEIVRLDPETGRREAVLVPPAPGKAE